MTTTAEMVTSAPAPAGEKPIALAYASPQRVSAGMVAVGVISIVIGAMGMFFISVGALYYGGVFAWTVYAVIERSANTSVALINFCGWVVCLLGHVTLLLGGADLLRGRATAIGRHLMFVRLVVYGVLTMLAASYMDAARGFGGFPPIGWAIMSMFWPRNGACLVALLIYPAVVLRLPMLKPPGPVRS